MSFAAPVTNLTWKERFLEYVLIGDGCWPWVGARQQQGYGLWTPNPKDAQELGIKKMRVVHRVMWQMLRGPIPDGMELDHLCKFKGCVNPDHLEPVTHEVNLRRAGGYCKIGHRLEETRRVWKSGRSCCGVCQDRRNKAKRDARQARGLKKPGRKPKSSD